MAASQTPQPPNRRPPVDDRSATETATPPGADPTPGTTEHDTGHQDARGTPPMAHPSPDPSTPPRPPRRRRSAGNRRATIDTATRQAIDAAIGRLVADAPPLSEETRERLAALLSTTTYRPNTTRRRPAA